MIVKLHDENGRLMVEYESFRGDSIYKDAESYVEGSDFSEALGLNEDSTEDQLEKAKGVSGFRQLAEKEKKAFLRNKIGNIAKKPENDGLDG